MQPIHIFWVVQYIIGRESFFKILKYKSFVCRGLVYGSEM